MNSMSSLMCSNLASLMGYQCMSRDVALLLDESWGAPVHASSEAGPSGLHERQD